MDILIRSVWKEINKPIIHVEYNEEVYLFM